MAITQVGYVQQMHAKTFNFSVVNASAYALLKGNKQMNQCSLIVSSPTTSDYYDIGAPSLLMSDSYGRLMRLTYTLKVGNGLVHDNVCPDIIGIGLDLHTIKTNEYGYLYVDVVNLTSYNDSLITKINENDNKKYLSVNTPSLVDDFSIKSTKQYITNTSNNDFGFWTNGNYGESNSLVGEKMYVNNDFIVDDIYLTTITKENISLKNKLFDKNSVLGDFDTSITNTYNHPSKMGDLYNSYCTKLSLNIHNLIDNNTITTEIAYVTDPDNIYWNKSFSGVGIGYATYSYIVETTGYYNSYYNSGYYDPSAPPVMMRAAINPSAQPGNMATTYYHTYYHTYTYTYTYTYTLKSYFNGATYYGHVDNIGDSSYQKRMAFEKLKVNTANLTKADDKNYGVVKIDGNTLKTPVINGSKTLKVITSNLSKATRTQPGIVTPGHTLSLISSTGKINVDVNKLDKASTTSWGVVKIGDENMSISNGVLSFSENTNNLLSKIPEINTLSETITALQNEITTLKNRINNLNINSNVSEKKIPYYSVSQIYPYYRRIDNTYPNRDYQKFYNKGETVSLPVKTESINERQVKNNELDIYIMDAFITEELAYERFIKNANASGKISNFRDTKGCVEVFLKLTPNKVSNSTLPIIESDEEVSLNFGYDYKTYNYPKDSADYYDYNYKALGYANSYYDGFGYYEYGKDSIISTRPNYIEGVHYKVDVSNVSSNKDNILISDSISVAGLNKYGIALLQHYDSQTKNDLSISSLISDITIYRNAYASIACKDKETKYVYFSSSYGNDYANNPVNDIKGLLSNSGIYGYILNDNNLSDNRLTVFRKSKLSYNVAFSNKLKTNVSNSLRNSLFVATPPENGTTSLIENETIISVKIPYNRFLPSYFNPDYSELDMVQAPTFVVSGSSDPIEPLAEDSSGSPDNYSSSLNDNAHNPKYNSGHSAEAGNKVWGDGQQFDQQYLGQTMYRYFNYNPKVKLTLLDKNNNALFEPITLNIKFSYGNDEYSAIKTVTTFGTTDYDRGKTMVFVLDNASILNAYQMI